MSCIDNIVSFGACPDEGPSLSGFTLLDAPGISPKALANIASETYTSGANLAMKKKAITLLQIRNDLVGAMQANKVVSMVTDPVYETSIFNPAVNVGISDAIERGITLHKSNAYRGTLRQTIIKAIQCYPLGSGDGTIKIYVAKGNNVVDEYSYPVSLAADRVNTFGEEELDGFPFVLPDASHAVKVLIDGDGISFASAQLTCMKGCNGSMPNPCGWVDGWDGNKAVKAEGYGVNVQFYCHCDYDKLMCDLAKSFTGELIWLKWQMNIYDEHYKSDRFNNWVIYNRDEINKLILPDLQNKYNTKWNDLMGNMLGILKNYRDDCLQCRGIRWETNV
jgi:hypothetical protein